MIIVVDVAEMTTTVVVDIIEVGHVHSLVRGADHGVALIRHQEADPQDHDLDRGHFLVQEVDRGRLQMPLDHLPLIASEGTAGMKKTTSKFSFVCQNLPC